MAYLNEHETMKPWQLEPIASPVAVGRMLTFGLTRK